MTPVIETGERAGAVICNLLWPKRGTHGASCYPWRRWIAAFVIGLSLAVPCWGLVTYGVLEHWGLHGFVTSDKFARAENGVDYLTRRAMQQDIEGKCWDAHESQGKAHRDALRDLATLEADYRTRFNDGYQPASPCS